MDFSNKCLTVNGKNYIVIEQIDYENHTYLYLLNDNDELDSMFCEVNGKDAAYYYMAKEIKEKCENKLSRQKERFSKFKNIEFDQIEDVVTEEVNNMTPEELIGTMDEFFQGF